MTRSKKTPTVHKPPFDEENALRFAEMAPETVEDSGKARKRDEMTRPKGPQPERQPISLLLKSDIVTALQHEAARKGKGVGQIIEKLVAKHLGKHK